MLTILTLMGVGISGGLYLFMSWKIHLQTSTLDDHIPLSHFARQARIVSSREFNAATVATTISLATLILAYSELASYLGLWLLWTVITTAIGILVVRSMAPQIWERMSASGNYRPTLHEFLGASFGSPTLAKSAALCTSMGFLGALAVELTVGSTFLAGLAPGIPVWLAVVLLSSIGVLYTMLGGFRAVVVTDRIQMWAIWASILALGTTIIMQILNQGGIAFLAAKIPKTVYDFSWREGLGSFLVGIFIINVPTFIADMSIWQRIAASRNKQIVTKGLLTSALSATISWAAFTIIACSLIALVVVKEGENPLLTFLALLGSNGGIIASTLFLIIIIGLYAASLSTASTQLIAAAHTLHTDILRYGHNRESLASSSHELVISKAILLVAAVASIAIVGGLRIVGFSIADLVFAVYGAQLGLVPAVLLALYGRKNSLYPIGKWASVAVLFGFVAGWGCAGYGKAINDGDLVFLSPAASLLVSCAILATGWLVTRTHRRTKDCV